MPRIAKFGAVALVSVVLIATAYAVLARIHLVEHTYGISRPRFYTGPVTIVEQRFRAEHDWLTRIDVWAYADGASRPAEVFARLTPEGSNRPIRESRTTVHARRFSNAKATFDFEPIPDSSGRIYTLSVGVLSSAPPWVLLGMISSGSIPEGAALITGTPTPYGDNLAMRTFGIDRYLEVLRAQAPSALGLAGRLVLFGNLAVFSVMVAQRWLSTPESHFWRGIVLPAAVISAWVMGGGLLIVLAGTALFSVTRLPLT